MLLQERFIHFKTHSELFALAFSGPENMQTQGWSTEHFDICCIVILQNPVFSRSLQDDMIVIDIRALLKNEYRTFNANNWISLGACIVFKHIHLS